MMDKNIDRHLDVPAEANRDKHMNYLDEESRDESHSGDERTSHTKEEQDRRREWEEGLKEGRQAASKNND